MQSPQAWNAPLSHLSRRVAGTARPFQHLIPKRQPYSATSKVHIENADHGRFQENVTEIPELKIQRCRSRRKGEPELRSASRPASRIIKPDDSDLVDTNSLLKTLLAHQEANATRARIRAIAGKGTSQSQRIAKGDTVAKHVELEPGQGPAPADYAGNPRPLHFDWEIMGKVPRDLRLPWMKELDTQKPSRERAVKRLTTEIRALDRFLSPTSDEFNAAQTALKDIREFAIDERSYGVERLDLIGSRASGLATALSDLDLNLVPRRLPTNDSGKEWLENKLLQGLWKKLKYGKPPDIRFIPSYYVQSARVPIVTVIHRTTGLEFQIQCANSAYGSLELVKGLQAEWPTLQSLFMVIKQMLQMRGLCKGSQGGLTSYPLLNMIVVSLKHHQVKTDRFDAGTQLLQFLDYWSDVDFYTTGIAHHPSKYLSSRLEGFEDDNPLTAPNAVSLITQDPIAAIPVQFDVRKNLADLHEAQNHYRMALYDPANPYNDLGRSAHRIKDVQATLIAIRQKLKEDMSEWDRAIRANGEAEPQPTALLRSLVEGDYSIYNMNRRRLSPSEEEENEK